MFAEENEDDLLEITSANTTKCITNTNENTLVY